MSSLSQEEIDSLLRGAQGNSFVTDVQEAPDGSSPAQMAAVDDFDTEQALAQDISQYFTPEEIDALGEIGNISMGTSATTMNMLLGRKVTITTPQVALYQAEDALKSFTCPFLAISVEYVEGLFGKNLLVLRDYDAALITDLLMGGEGVVDKDHIELSEIHLSAVSEVMNQMIGSSATAMSNMMGDGVNISPPQVVRMTCEDSIGQFLDDATPVVKVSFDMEIEGLLKSKLLQIMSVDMAKELINSLMQPAEKPAPPPPAAARAPEPPRAPAPPPAAAPRAAAPSQSTYAAPAAGYASSAPAASSASSAIQDERRVREVKPAMFESFESGPVGQHPQYHDVSTANFDLINDIPLQVTVELGKTKKNLSDILNFGVGSIIVLDKQAGELVDVLVNGKRIAKGEVVVIDENYGVRITELIRT